MKAQIESYFSFLLYPDDPNFLPIYWVASFLCPFYRFIITSEEMPVVRAHLESKFHIVNCQYSPKENIERCYFLTSGRSFSSTCP